MAIRRVVTIVLALCMTNVLCQDLFRGPVQSSSCYDQNTIKLVYQQSQHVELLRCPEDKPFCNPEEVICVQNNPKLKFYCPSEVGWYPDIWNPKKYYICVNGASYEFECKSGSWKQENKTCSQEPDIINFNCAGLDVVNVTHQTSKDLYATCHKGKAISINQCPIGYVFSEDRNECEFECKGEGIIKDLLNDRRYFVCFEENNQMKKEIKTCRFGMKYDIKFGGCVDEAPIGSRFEYPPK